MLEPIPHQAPPSQAGKGSFQNCQMSKKSHFRFQLQLVLGVHNPKCIHQLLRWESTLHLYNKLIPNFHTLLFHGGYNLFKHGPCNITKSPHPIYKNMAQMLLRNQFKCQMIDSNIQICYLVKTNVLINEIDQGQKVSKHITLETTLTITIHVIHLSITNVDCCNKITNEHVTQLNKFNQRTNCFQEWHNGIQPQQRLYIS